MSNTFQLVKNGKTVNYSVFTRAGKISPTLLALVKSGNTQILTNTPLIWNTLTRRLVYRDVYLTQANTLREKFRGKLIYKNNSLLPPPAWNVVLYPNPSNSEGDEYSLSNKTFSNYDFINPNGSFKAVVGDVFVIVYEELKLNTKMERVRIILQTKNNTIVDKIYELNTTATYSTAGKNKQNARLIKLNQEFDIDINYRNDEIFYDFILNSEVSKCDIPSDEEPKLIFIKPNVVNPPAQVYQIFREGVSNCILTPIYNSLVTRDWTNSKTGKKLSKATIHRYDRGLALLDETINKYKNGVPQDELDLITKALNISITIYDILNNVLHTSKGSSNPRYAFKYMNTRFNHAEILYDNYNNEQDTAIIKKNEYLNFAKNIITSNKWWICQGSISSPVSISTLHGNYRPHSEFIEAKTRFFNEYNLKLFAMNYNDNTLDLNNFVIAGCRMTSHKCFNTEIIKQKNRPSIYETDMTKAYTQFHQAPFFQGFPSIFNCFVRREFSLENLKVGYYQIEGLDLSGCNVNTQKIFKAFDICDGVYTSPEILFFASVGMRFKIVAGAYSIKPLNLNLSKEYLYEKEDGIPHYSKLVGQLSMLNTYDKYFFPATKELCEVLSKSYPVSFCEYDNVGVINKPKTNTKHYKHIAGFITAYTRLNIFKKIMTFDYENIVGIKLDSILYTGTKIEDDELFRTKVAKVSGDNWTFASYLNKFYLPTLPRFNIPDDLDYCDFTKKTYLFNGMGGTGKTHTTLTDNRINCLYSSICWSLVCDKMINYNCMGTSFAKLVGDECKAYFEEAKVTYPGVIFIDEITQIHKDTLAKLFNMFQYSIIVLAGDVDLDGTFYQCSFPKVEVMDADFINNYINKVITFTKSYRCKDDKLMDLMLEIRQAMRVNTPINELIGILRNYHLAFYTPEKVKKYFTKYDFVLCSTATAENSQAKLWTNLLWSCGERYLKRNHQFTDTFKKLKNDKILLNGELSYEKPTSGEYEARHAFTIHSFQGRTINNPNKLIFDLDHIFDYQQIYTAISRCQYLDQLILSRIETINTPIKKVNPFKRNRIEDQQQQQQQQQNINNFTLVNKVIPNSKPIIRNIIIKEATPITKAEREQMIFKLTN